jgi:hypothetical protein
LSCHNTALFESMQSMTSAAFIPALDSACCLSGTKVQWLQQYPLTLQRNLLRVDFHPAPDAPWDFRLSSTIFSSLCPSSQGLRHLDEALSRGQPPCTMCKKLTTTHNCSSPCLASAVGRNVSTFLTASVPTFSEPCVDASFASQTSKAKVEYSSDDEAS